MNKSYDEFDPELGLLDDETEKERKLKEEQFYKKQLEEQETNKRRWDEMYNNPEPYKDEVEELSKKLPFFMTNEETKKYGFVRPTYIKTNQEITLPEGPRQRRTPTSRVNTPTNNIIPVRPATPLLPTTVVSEEVGKKSICPPEGCITSGGIRRRRKTRKTRKVRKSRKSKKSKRKSKRKI